MMEQLDIQVEHLQFVVSRTVSSDWKMPLRANAHYLLAYFKNGSGYYQIGSSKQPVHQDHIILIPPGQIYQPIMNPDTPWSYCTVGVHLAFGHELARQALHQVPFISYVPELSDAFQHLQIAWDSGRPTGLMQCRSIVLDILQHLLWQALSKTNYTQLDPAFAMIHRNTGKNFTLETLSQGVNMSVSYFRRLFKKATGMTVLQYQNTIKVERAKQLLMSGDFNVTEAAQAIGIDDIFYFSRLFRKITGRKPSDYMPTL